ncbi:MAG: mandelate racemase/muconate lactonizing enzyme family protein [Sedimentisphaerales bacterium]|nr:mandelate racemase/muconate lactonizing enzyme family protein [Sedimentisphaerales bacterium]
MNRRTFLKTASVAGVVSFLLDSSTSGAQRSGKRITRQILDTIASQPALQVPELASPVKIESMELLQSGNTFMVRTRSTDGAEGNSVTNSLASIYYPILLKRVIPYFIGKDARQLDSLIDGVFLHASNYKLQGQALWCPVAWCEFSILDMLGRMTNKPLGDLLGGIRKQRIGFYIASGNRDTTPQQEVDILKRELERTGARAVKFKVGGRMSNDADSLPGRTEGLIPLARKALGDEIAIHADSNGSYNPPRAIEVGRMLEDINATFYEEPCPFDRLEDTKRVADALSIPIAGGECESSQYRFRWMIEHRGLDVAQPDLHYYGGFIRSTRVARMAAAAGMTITPHMSGGNTGYVEVMQFASYIPNIGPYMEYKGEIQNSHQWFDPPLRAVDGKIAIPTAPGLGLSLDPALLKNARPVTTI